jgi:hypothetical protein
MVTFRRLGSAFCALLIPTPPLSPPPPPPPRSADTFLYSFGKNVLQRLEPKSLLFAVGDVNCNILDYLQQVHAAL